MAGDEAKRRADPIAQPLHGTTVPSLLYTGGRMSASAALATQASLGHVLIVEDDAAVADSLAEVLRDEGYDVDVCSNGQVALDWLAANAAPDLILLDLWMPVLSGEEFRARQLAAPELADIPVIVISAAADARDRARALGAATVIVKPIDLTRLLDAVDEHRRD